MKNKIKLNKDNIIVLIFLILSIIAISANVRIRVNDELWNFSNIYKMCNGYEIYKDLNVIITPLFFYIGELLFKVFGANYFVFRVYNVIIYTMFFYLIYQIFMLLKIDKKIAKGFVAMIYAPTALAFTQGANYNVLAFNFVLLGVYLYIRNKNKRMANNVWQGIMLFLIFMTKQNVGAYYVIGLIGAKLVNIIKDKKTFKENFIDLVYIATEFSVMIGIFVLYLMSTNNLYNAVNLTILGMGEFINNIMSNSIFWLFVVLVVICVPAYIVNCKKIKLEDDIKYNIKILLCFAIPMLLIMYPIFNRYHMALSLTVGLIALFYALESLFLKELLSEIKVGNVIKTIFWVILLVSSVISISFYCFEHQKYEYNHPYYGSNIQQKDIDSINKVCEFIRKNDAQIISSQSDLYMNIINRNNGFFDLPFKGNLGIEGQQGLIDRVEKEKFKIILLDNEERNKMYYQNPEKLREYIINNYDYKGELENFLIYEKR